ncbi:MAG: sigma-70 family RNA polymerase sigma factor [Paenibacillaceae bacterium]|nr:sigma-70 family RNA polymerase sigma factor [Paenibacillaceae bacterium]
MSKYPHHIQKNITDSHGQYYSLYRRDNILRCKEDKAYLGEAMLANEDLIWHSVHKYVGKPETIITSFRIDKDDILQLGRLGFFKAMMAFDPDRGVKFSSFAVIAIVREIKCYLRDSANMVRITRTANDLLNRIARLEVELGYLPPYKDVAAMLDEQEDRVKKALQIGKAVKFLDEPIPNTGGVTSLEIIPDTSDMESGVLDKVMIDAVIAKISEGLTNVEISVVKKRLIEGLSQTQTADREGISQVRVSRIMRKVASMLKDIDKIIKESN